MTAERGAAAGGAARRGRVVTGLLLVVAGMMVPVAGGGSGAMGPVAAVLVVGGFVLLFSGLGRRARVPYLLLLPGGLWLVVFFVVPMLRLLGVSLESGLFPNYRFSWEWSNYVELFTKYLPQLQRSLVYGITATVVALLISYPLAYFIAFRGGKFKNFLLVMLLMPFLMPFLLRTLSWKIILADNGVVVRALQAVHLVSQNGTLLATGVAVVAGIVYNFLPFTTLPIYVSLEKIDPALIEAANDLYAGPAVAFRRVTLPLSMPGVVAGTLLTFIPAIGDYVNATLLGTPRQFMLGNVIQSRFLKVLDYPAAAALSFALMLVILVLIILYVRVAGTEDLVA